MEDWFNVNSDISNSYSSDSSDDENSNDINKLVLKLNVEEEYITPEIDEIIDITFDKNEISDEMKIQQIYKVKNGIIKISDYDKDIINNLDKNQKELYLSNYNLISGNSDELSKIAKIAYCIFYNIKNTKNIKYKHTKIYGTVYWELYFKRIFKRLINFTKYSILYDNLYFNSIKINSYNTFNLTGLDNQNLKNIIEIWKFNSNKFNMVNRYIKNKYFKKKNKSNSFLNNKLCEYNKENICYKKYNYWDNCYPNNYINENNIDIINNILKKAILSYKFYNESLIKTDDECIRMIYSSSAQLQGWYNFYYTILNNYFEDWKYKLKKNNKFIDNIKFNNNYKII